MASVPMMALVVLLALAGLTSRCRPDVSLVSVRLELLGMGLATYAAPALSSVGLRYVLRRQVEPAMWTVAMRVASLVFAIVAVLVALLELGLMIFSLGMPC